MHRTDLREFDKHMERLITMDTMILMTMKHSLYDVSPLSILYKYSYILIQTIILKHKQITLMYSLVLMYTCTWTTHYILYYIYIYIYIYIYTYI